MFKKEDQIKFYKLEVYAIRTACCPNLVAKKHRSSAYRSFTKYSSNKKKSFQKIIDCGFGHNYSLYLRHQLL